ncbi:dTDP-glucose 4,6-dehydratase [Paramagnetospirillum magneticum]|uniref:dTDP-glucose 4,6-dehydratase n=1 Tax=Paramagnetospirillum magneticum (strain ATCC 700264 / AMB-1) TaxID=342108 RepID=Q2WBB3_PARM1|nr:dTDP-glucose 4,6-dehydratase [Paramagnetospirillum magneticum]BAE48862.1 dTDP-D-glucose 4,6-dehydratase [Paramagnetospirillum magneticum AMB-1]
MSEQSLKNTWRVLVTGGAGFIGSALVGQLLASGHSVLTFDKLTYAGHLANLDGWLDHPNHSFVQGDIAERAQVEAVVEQFQPTTIMHLAAESHVDRSIASAGEFVRTNVIGTFTMLEAAAAHRARLDGAARERFRFLHVSTDEVFGSLGPDEAFDENSRYQPNSPYSATKAASDHLARAWSHTYGLPVLVSNCSNNYGPRQFPEKLIPLMILNAVEGKPLPVYGDGCQVRDWLHVEDHARALATIVERGRPGEVYCVGGESERTNMEVVHTLCALLDGLRPRAEGRSHAELIRHVTDRPGHDRRYAMNIARIRAELDWKPRETFESGLAKTVEWYLANGAWCAKVVADAASRLPRDLARKTDGTLFERKASA